MNSMSAPEQFRKKPVVIEAMKVPVQNDMENWGRLAIFLGIGNHWQVRNHGHNLEIKTLEGKMLAATGDWVVKGIAGEFYPCKPEIFAQTYEPVTQAAPVSPRTPQDYAIEHGVYLADAAQAYLDEKNRYDMAVAGYADDEVTDTDSLSDHHQALRDAIYEFRKRAAVTLTPSSKEKV